MTKIKGTVVKLRRSEKVAYITLKSGEKYLNLTLFPKSDGTFPVLEYIKPGNKIEASVLVKRNEYGTQLNIRSINLKARGEDLIEDVIIESIIKKKETSRNKKKILLDTEKIKITLDKDKLSKEMLKELEKAKKGKEMKLRYSLDNTKIEKLTVNDLKLEKIEIN